jgi:hypothetical protein
MSRRHQYGAVLPMCLLLLSIVFTGCATFSQRYYVEVAECRPEWRAPHSSFIRLDLSGTAFFTVARFEKGWYDKTAVDALFSTVTSRVNELNAEVSDPPDGAASKPGGTAQNEQSPSRAIEEAADDNNECIKRRQRVGQRVTRVYGPNGKEITDAAGKRLVMFVMGNPDAIVNQIATTVNTTEVSRVIAGFARRSEVTAAADAENNLDLAGRRHEALVSAVDAFSKWLGVASPKAALPPQEARDQITGLVRQIDIQLQGR